MVWLKPCIFYLYRELKKCILINLHQTGAGQPIIVTTVVPVGPGVTHMVCPHCHAEIDTAVRTEPGLLAWLSGGLLLLMGYVG